MPNINYPNLDLIQDEEINSILATAKSRGTPRPESQAIRAWVPAVIKTFTAAWEQTFIRGVLDHDLKELCRVYVSKTLDCGYCEAQRSPDASTDETIYDEVLHYKDSPTFSEREKAALAYTDAIVWDANLATTDTWKALRQHFTSPEIVELGFFIALTSGQQRWIKTLDIAHGQILAE